MMPASSRPTDVASSIVKQFRAEFENPTKASRRATHAANCRAAGERRQLVDPTTCERDYSGAAFEFMQAMQASGQMFPTWSEILEVVRKLDY
jgi:hypothetical protein